MACFPLILPKYSLCYVSSGFVLYNRARKEKVDNPAMDRVVVSYLHRLRSCRFVDAHS